MDLFNNARGIGIAKRIRINTPIALRDACVKAAKDGTLRKKYI
jgi:hypothetical protein